MQVFAYPIVNQLENGYRPRNQDEACVITLGLNVSRPQDYPSRDVDFTAGPKRITSQLTTHEFEGTLLTWTTELPVGCPEHKQIPYAFKPFCFLTAAEMGFNVILWLDASIQIIANPRPLFDLIKKDGYLFFRENHSLGQYCTDQALLKLGISREESMSMPSCWTCAVGLDLRHTNSKAFLSRWYQLAIDGVSFCGPKWSGVSGWPMTASNDSRVTGHRPDQTTASAIALQLGMSNWQTRKFFRQFLSNDRHSLPLLSAAQ